MSADLAQLRKLCREAELDMLEQSTPSGTHVRVISELAVVHWWPDSRRRTAFVEGQQRGITYATAKQVVKLATERQQ